ncbi:tRNA uridine-5-carboxymethylaminomethyl(34) synthesis enzyme MnmG [Bacillota bacterium Meth-B3]|nr:tRNA uridine-5-carboxymethylaminomethyl(34) synthesis enzyme MnmG [Christensenellaceae bacterium]MEA5068614.1 tRNA uridine-5-carboxymethylaminomethyl(34) synthesis enzyme MnmG [Christensenellaceae bacterium]
MMDYDIVVIGAGHAGCEAALAAARLGLRTLMLTLNLDSVALMPCNPSIGGTAKGHLVRELDALGGEMGRAIDDTMLQSRMLNLGKGPAVHSLRAQADKRAYQARMRAAIDAQAGLTLRQAEARRIETDGKSVTGVVTATGARIGCRAAVVCAGVYLDSRIIIGEHSHNGGPQGLMAAGYLAGALRELGFTLRRFKTGTPARVDGRTVDFSQMTPQPGDEPVVPFSFMTDRPLHNRALCYLTYTTERTHRLIRDNLHRAPMYSGLIHGTGARYCPSIEDKVVRFADKDRHGVFLEPEGEGSIEWYVQGMSTSLPEEVQRAVYQSVPGLERAELMRLAYAIEYETIDPTELTAELSARRFQGLYFAGQINGTSGYEEAAAQGLLAGLNAALWLGGGQPLTLTRADAYIGVLVDDLVTKGVDEPYRMMTSRAEYRLHLRQDNADLRLTELGRRAGLADDARYEKMCRKREETARAIELIDGARLTERLKRPEARLKELVGECPELSTLMPGALEQAEISIKYQGYLNRQQSQIEQFTRAEGVALPEGIDYLKIDALRIEARQKLDRQRPASIGQASRIPGVSPGDIQVLLIWLERWRRTRS